MNLNDAFFFERIFSNLRLHISKLRQLGETRAHEWSRYESPSDFSSYEGFPRQQEKRFILWSKRHLWFIFFGCKLNRKRETRERKKEREIISDNINYSFIQQRASIVLFQGKNLIIIQASRRRIAKFQRTTPSKSNNNKEYYIRKCEN